MRLRQLARQTGAPKAYRSNARGRLVPNHRGRGRLQVRGRPPMGWHQSVAVVDRDRAGQARAPDLHCNDERTELPPRRLEVNPDKKPDRTIPHHLRPLRKTGVLSATPRTSCRASPSFGGSEVQRSPKPPRRPQGLPPLTDSRARVSTDEARSTMPSTNTLFTNEIRQSDESAGKNRGVSPSAF